MHVSGCLWVKFTQKLEDSFIKNKSLFFSKNFVQIKINYNFADGEMAEWSNAAVLKTVVPKGTGGSNPSFSAKKIKAVP